MSNNETHEGKCYRCGLNTDAVDGVCVDCATELLISTRCLACGALVRKGVELCEFHTMADESGWSIGNRAWCEFVHRGGDAGVDAVAAATKRVSGFDTYQVVRDNGQLSAGGRVGGVGYLDDITRIRATIARNRWNSLGISDWHE